MNPEMVDFTASSVSTTSMKLSWNETDGIVERYHINILKNTSSIQNHNLSKEIKEKIIDDLVPGQTYNIIMFTETVGGKISKEIRKVFIMKPEKVDFDAPSVSTTSLNITWNKPDGIVERYHINIVNNTDSIQNHNLSKEIKEKIIDDLVPGQTYNIIMYTQTEGGKISEKNNTVFIMNPEKVDFAVSSISTTSLNITWNKPDGIIERYHITILDNITSIQNHNLSKEIKEKIIDDLVPGQTYNIIMYAETAGGKTSEKNKSVFIMNPEKVDFAASSVSTTSINITWNKPDGIVERYHIDILNDTASIQNHNLSKEIKEKIIDDLVPGQTYNIIMYTETAGGKTSEKNKTVFIMNPEKLDFAVSSVSTTSLRLNWNKPDGIVERYHINILKDTASIQNHNLSKEIKEKIIDDLVPGQTYNIIMYTETAGGKISEKNNTVFIMNPEKVDFAVSSISTTSLNITWNKPDGIIERYHITILDNITSIQNHNLSKEIKEKIIDDLVPGQTYNIIMYAETAGGKTSEKNKSVFIMNPEKVDFAASSVSTTSINITWNKPDGIVERYHIDILNDTASIQNHNLSKEIKEKIIVDLVPGQTYDIIMYTETAGGKTSEKNKTVFIMNPEKLDFAVSSVSTTSLRLNWNKPDGMVERYHINILKDTASIKNYSLSKEIKEKIIDDLVPGQTYNIIMYTETAGGKISEKNNTVFIMNPEKVDFAVSSISTTSLNITWNKPDGIIERYHITIVNDTSIQNHNLSKRSRKRSLMI
jgi:predicted lipoprotein